MDSSSEIQYYYLLFWLEEKRRSVFSDEEIKKASRKGREGGYIKEFEKNDILKLKWSDGKRYEAKILEISADKNYLESLQVTEDGKSVVAVGNNGGSEAIIAERKALKKDRIRQHKEKEATASELEKAAQEGTQSEENSCNQTCNLCCKLSPILHMLPTVSAEHIQKMFEMIKFWEAAQELSRTLSVKQDTNDIETWRICNRDTVEIGGKGSGVFLNQQEFSVAVSTARNFKKCPEKSLFRKLLTIALGEEKLHEMARSGIGATQIPGNLFCAIEDEVNATFFKSSQPFGRAHYIRTVNNFFGHVRSSLKSGPSKEGEKVEKKEVNKENAAKRKMDGDELISKKKKKQKSKEVQPEALTPEAPIKQHLTTVPTEDDVATVGREYIVPEVLPCGTMSPNCESDGSQGLLNGGNTFSPQVKPSPIINDQSMANMLNNPSFFKSFISFIGNSSFNTNNFTDISASTPKSIPSQAFSGLVSSSMNVLSPLRNNISEGY